MEAVAMLVTALLSCVVAAQITVTVAAPAQAGRVVAAPHGGYDRATEDLASAVAGRLGWGSVAAVGYRSEPLGYWYDVNRPTERPWVGGGFGAERVTGRAQAVFEQYMRAVARAGAQLAGERLELLVELHGHSRRVRLGGASVRLQAIELATRGFTHEELRRLEAEYERLQADVPPDLRVPLAIYRLHDPYEYEGWLVPFYFHASGAQDHGSLHEDVARRALHFELPGRCRETARAREAYTRLLAALLGAVDDAD
jgi:hypothetical protein